jgi:hypothetical protein
MQRFINYVICACSNSCDLSNTDYVPIKSVVIQFKKVREEIRETGN